MAMRRATPRPVEVAVAILAGAPVPGEVKAPLVSALGAEAAASLQTLLIERVVAAAAEAAVGPVTIWASPDESHAIFQRMVTRHGVTLARQPEGDLGQRMAAVLPASAPGLVVGTDCPVLAPDHVREAAQALCEDIDVAVIPAEDGGYVLIGTRRAQPALFADMEWGTETVWNETRRRLIRLGLSWREPAKLWDVDRPEDVDRMWRENLI